MVETEINKDATRQWLDYINSVGKYKPKSGKKWQYLIPAIILGFAVSLYILMLIFKVRLIFQILYLFCAIPLVLLNFIFISARTILDKEKIVSALIKKFAKNYIMADFFMENGRIKSTAVLLNKDGITFDYNGGLYTIVNHLIWYDYDNRPHSFYLYNFPNPLQFPFEKDIKLFIERLSMEAHQNNKMPGVEFDISYNAESLQMFKKDKLLKDFHTDPGAEKMVMIMAGLLALSNIIWLIIFLVAGRGG